MPDTPRLSLKSLRAFVAVVDHGSISAAARTLNIAASAVAASVDQVEAELGAALLIRTRAKGISATPEGREMAARFRTLLEDYTACLTRGRDVANRLTGTLRIGYYAPVAPAFLPGLLGPMLADHPALTLDLHEHDHDSVQEALLSGQIDIALLVGQDLRPGLITQPLLSLPPYVLAPADHPIIKTPLARLPDVAQHPIILLDRPLAAPYLNRLFTQAGLTPHIAARANSTEMVRSLVGAGLGLAILNMHPRTDVTYAGDRLIARPLDAGLPRLDLVLAQANPRPRRLVTQFAETLHAWMQTDAANSLTIT